MSVRRIFENMEIKGWICAIGVSARGKIGQSL